MGRTELTWQFTVILSDWIGDLGTYDCLIIGGGIVGLSCFLKLSQQGLKVAVFDKNMPGSGVSSKSGATITIAHRSQRVMERSLYSLAFYKKLVNEGHISGHTETSSLFINSQSTCENILIDANVLGIELNLIEFPKLHDSMALTQEGALVLAPKNTCMALLELGKRAGGTVFYNTKVLEVADISGSELAVISWNEDKFEIQSAKWVVMANGVESLPLLCSLKCNKYNIFPINYEVNCFQIYTEKPTEFEYLGKPISECIFVDNRNHINFYPSIYSNDVFAGIPLPQDIRYVKKYPHPEARKNQKKNTLSQLQKYLNGYHISSSPHDLLSHDTACENGARGIVEKIAENSHVILVTGFTGAGFRQAPAVANEVYDIIRR